MTKKLNKKLMIASISSLALVTTIGAVTPHLLNQSSTTTTLVQQSTSNTILTNPDHTWTYRELNTTNADVNKAIQAFNDAKKKDSSLLASIIFNARKAIFTANNQPSALTDITINSIQNEAGGININFTFNGQSYVLKTIPGKEYDAEYNGNEINIWLVVGVSVGSVAVMTSVLIAVLVLMCKKNKV